MFFQGDVLLPLQIIGIAAVFSSMVDCFSRVQWLAAAGQTLLSQRIIFAALPITIIGLLMLAFVLFLRGIPHEAPLHIQPPLRGIWRTASGGRTALTNHHHGNPQAQNFAVDLVLAQGDAEASRGQTVYSPVAGEVQFAIATRGEGEDAAEGNVVVLRTAKGVDLWFAHLEKDTVPIAVGAQVKAGQPIGAVGATGSATVPHLHLHAQLGEDPVPIIFEPNHKFLVRGDTISF